MTPPVGDMGSCPVWLVTGADPALVAGAVHRLLNRLVGGADRSLVLEDYGGEELDLAAVAEACRTPPFLADRRVVLVRGEGHLSSEEVAPLLAYLEDPLPTTALVIDSGGGKVAPKLVAAAKAHGHLVDTAAESRDSGRFVAERLREAPVRLDAAATQLLASHLGEDLGRLSSLLELLAGAYGEGARLGVEEVSPYLGQAGSTTPWALTDAVDSGDSGLALQLLHRLLEAGERHPLEVLAILHRHLRNLLAVDSPSIQGEAEAAAAMGIPHGRSTFPAKKALNTSRRWGTARLAEAASLVAQAELDLKGASAWPPSLVLEVLVARLCRLGRAAGGGRANARASQPSGRRAQALKRPSPQERAAGD